MAKINPNFSARPACAGWFCRVLVQKEEVKGAGCQYYGDDELCRDKEENGIIYYGPLPISSLGEGLSVAEKLACVLSGKEDVEHGE